MSNFYENDLIEDDEFFMTTPEFFTNQVFGSRDELIIWVKNLALSLGIVVVTKRSNKYPNGFMYKVVLMCDHGGKYKAKGSSRAPRTRKTDCPFELEAKYSNECNFWTLTVICDEHNHRPLQNLEGHPYAKRLTQDEFSLVAELTRMNVAPRDILSIVKERNLGNVSTISTIYNARTKLRMVEQVGNSPMQVLMAILHSNNYVYEFSTTGSNELENLFFVHPTSFNTWRAFPHVLIIDATYKTNYYNMPFVQIVGVTSTNKTFSIAFAFMQNEKTVNYTWVLNCLKLTLDTCMHPRVIVTDRELALVNACKDVFPDAAQLLCRVHISRNICDHCRQTIRPARDWCNFNALWSKLQNSATMDSYSENYTQLQSFLIKYPRALKYLNETWLNKYKEMFVSVWIDQHLNFGNNTTNRVESQHAVLKKYLKSTKSTLDKFVGCIDRLVQSQHTSIKESFEKSRIVRYGHHNLRCFKLLRGFVSNEALDIIITNHSQVDSSNCDCRLRNSYGLPCSCELSMYISSGQCISLDSIDIFWRRLDFSPATSVQDDDDVSCESVLDHFKENFNKQSKVGRKSWLRKLKDIFSPRTANIREPQVHKNTRGRPKKSQQKRRAEFSSARHSCSAMPNFADSVKESARHSCFEFDLNEIPDEFEGSYTIDLNEVPPMNGSSLMDDIPKVFHPYIRNIQNVSGDGNCGYRALAVCFGLDEENSYEYIRQQMREELQHRYDIYKTIFVRDVDALYQDLCFFGSPCPLEQWMKMPEAGVLIANRFGVIVHSLSMSGSSTIFPFWSDPEECQPHRVLTIALVNAEMHYVMVDLQGDYPMPFITPYWNRNYISQSAVRWETMYRSRLELYVNLCHRESGFVDLSD